MIKGSFQQEEISILNVYVSNTKASSYVKQILTNLKREIDSDTFIVYPINTNGQINEIKSQQRNNRKNPNSKTKGFS